MIFQGQARRTDELRLVDGVYYNQYLTTTSYILWNNDNWKPKWKDDNCLLLSWLFTSVYLGMQIRKKQNIKRIWLKIEVNEAIS